MDIGRGGFIAGSSSEARPTLVASQEIEKGRFAGRRRTKKMGKTIFKFCLGVVGCALILIGVSAIIALFSWPGIWPVRLSVAFAFHGNDDRRTGLFYLGLYKMSRI